MNAIAVLAMASLALLACMCVAGALSHSFPDNVLQRCGLAAVGLACLALAYHVHRAGSIPPGCALMVVGLLLYAVGTAKKVIHFRSY